MNRSMTEGRRELARKHLRETAELEKKHREERLHELGENPGLDAVRQIIKTTTALLTLCDTDAEREAARATGFLLIVTAIK